MRVLGLSVPNQVNDKNQRWLTFLLILSSPGVSNHVISTCPNYQRRVPRMIWFIFLDDLGSPKIRCRTSSLVIRGFHEKCPIDRRHLWSNTWGLCKSPRSEDNRTLWIWINNADNYYQVHRSPKEDSIDESPNQTKLRPGSLKLFVTEGRRNRNDDRFKIHRQTRWVRSEDWRNY